MNTSKSIQIDCFSDILCIWAYISEVRINKLQQEFSTDLAIRHHYFSVFGHAEDKIIEKGGWQVYASHVQHLASQYPHIKIHPQIWSSRQPTSSMPAHLYLGIAKQLSEQRKLIQGGANILAQHFRQRFFEQGEDISKRSVLVDTIKNLDWSISDFEREIDSGRAYQALDDSLKAAHQLNVKVSPTLVFNHNRLRLEGNVSYRVMQANIIELLRQPQPSRAWC
ncbi:DsbA family oxidoreductase [Thalassotalea litorea]|nr:DsbA family protein [Thalassotalea litorea]